MKFVCALITVSDINRSRRFYEKVLEQKVKYDFGESITFEGDFSIHLRSHYEKLIDNKVLSGVNSFEFYFEAVDIDNVAERLKKHDVIFVHDVMEQPWGQKVIRFYDPDKNIIEVGEPLEALVSRLYKEGLGIKEIIEKVGVPEDFVNEIIKSGKHVL